MAGTVTHLAVADKMYQILGDGIIENPPLFFGGNIAPDAAHAIKNYRREDKKRSHLCEGIRSYGYGYPETAALFGKRVNEFIEKYCAGNNRNLYAGYAVHLLTDELYLLEIYKNLERQLIIGGAKPEEPDFRKNLADEVNSGNHREFFDDFANKRDVLASEYGFKHNIAEILNAAWDYEVRDFIGADEINRSKRWIIKRYISDPQPQAAPGRDLRGVAEFVDFAAKKIIERLSKNVWKNVQ